MNAARAPRAAVLAALFAIGITACAAREPRPTAPTDAPPPILLPVDAVEGDFLLRQRVTASYGPRSHRFDAVVQRRGPELALIGLGAMDTVAFRATLSSGEVSFENRTSRDVPFEPDHILADIQRVFYPWLPSGTACSPLERCVEPPCVCERRGEVTGIRVVERWRADHLVERRFTHPSRSELGEIVVTYEGWGQSARAPRKVTLANGWFGYELLIETLDAVEIPADD